MTLATCALGLAVAGCFGPHIANGGFTCSPTDNPPCPSGFYCVDGLCLDHPAPPGSGGNGTGGNGTGGDLATPAPEDLAMPATHDLASAPADMSMPPDLTPPPPDLACLPFKYDCDYDDTCCSECCAGACNIYGKCAKDSSF